MIYCLLMYVLALSSVSRELMLVLLRPGLFSKAGSLIVVLGGQQNII